jgi:hypothetical protein
MAYTYELLMNVVSEPGLRNKPMRIIVHPSETNADLGAIKIGKFFGRIFHWGGIKRKLPRIAMGAGTGWLLGRGWSGAVAGGLTAAAFRRRKGTSLFQDIYRGGLYGMIGGGVVGVGKSLFNYQGPRGYAGQAMDYLKYIVRGTPTGTKLPGGGVQRDPGWNITRMTDPITPITKKAVTEQSWWQKTADVILGTTKDGKTTGGILEPVLGIASTAMGMQMQQQQMEMQSQMMEEEQPPPPPPPQNGGGPPPDDGWLPGYGGYPPEGVPGDIGPGRAIGGPLQMMQDVVEAIKKPFIGKPMLAAVVVVGLGGGVAYYLYRRRR